MTVETAELARAINATSTVTYRNLVERVEHAQENYDDIRDRKGLRAKLTRKETTEQSKQSA